MCVLNCKKKLSKVQNKYKIFFKCHWVAVCVGEKGDNSFKKAYQVGP